MRSELPLDVLGMLAPVFSWVEGLENHALPRLWQNRRTPNHQTIRGLIEGAPVSDVERSWLLNQLPTYSFDNINEIAYYGRQLPAAPAAPRQHLPPPTRLAPPRKYDLLKVFDRLVDRYLVWSSGKVAVHQGRMEELHELGFRFPVGHLVRHAHARAATRGALSVERVLELPEPISLLPSNSFGLRTVIKRGLSEGHLHLNSMLTSEVSWADYVLKGFSGSALSRFDLLERRLVLLSRYAGRTLALATLFSTRRQEPPPEAFELLAALDAMYFARSAGAMRKAEALWRSVFSKKLWRIVDSRTGVAGDAPSAAGTQAKPPAVEMSRYLWRLAAEEWSTAEGGQRDWLLRWVDPAAYRMRNLIRSGSEPPPQKETVHDREQLVAHLHLFAHVELVRSAGGGRNPWTCSFLRSTFFRYLICRTHHWQLGIQQGRTTGLQHFKRYYDSNQRWTIGASPREDAHWVIQRACAWRGLRTLEGRVSPPRSIRDLLPPVEAFARQADRKPAARDSAPSERAGQPRQGRLKKFGLVVHFIKDHEARSPRGSELIGYAPPRYNQLRRKTRREAFQLFRILLTPSTVTPFVVGIDAANLELATPPEVFAPAFRFLRELPIELRQPDALDFVAQELAKDLRHLTHGRRLSMTFHVGEDFRHLLSGLRAIAEVIEFLKPQPGDRLGHAIALGIKPRTWAEQAGFQALVPRLEWLDTLVWVHHLLGPGHDLLGELRIEERIQRLGWVIYGAGRHLRDSEETPQDDGAGTGRHETPSDGPMPEVPHQFSPLLLFDAWRLRQLAPDNIELEPSTARPIRFRPIAGESPAHWRWNLTQRRILSEVSRQVGSSQAFKLLEQYWYSPEVQQAGAGLELVDMQGNEKAWLKVCREVQKKMQQRVRARQMVVEVNPSVNRMIGPMPRLADHHVFDLTLDKKRRLRRGLWVTINTDNPGVFNTSLAHEYYLLGELLIRQGVAEAEVVEWLEWMRQNGEDFSFVRQLPEARESPAMQRVLEQLRDRQRGLREYAHRGDRMRALWSWFDEPHSSSSSQRAES